MYPGPTAPDLGTFVADLEHALARRGHELARAVVDRRGGKDRHLALAWNVLATARRFPPRPQAEARARVGWEPDGTAFVCIGSLSERKNVLRLARVFEQRAEGSLAFVGDGPLRHALEGRSRIRLAGSVPHEEIPDWI